MTAETVFSEEKAPNVLLWNELCDTWRTLTAMLPNYEPDGHGYEVLVEAKRIVEVEMRAQGFESEYKRLVHPQPILRR